MSSTPQTPARPRRKGTTILIIACAVIAMSAVWIVLAGRSNAGDGPAPHAVRAERRQYSGAPPVIPHTPLSGRCVTCHTTEGVYRPPLGYAPANPHTTTSGMSAESRCRQCHVYRQTESLFVESEFQQSALTTTAGTRAHATAPPTVPHPLAMRDDCAACHTGPAARPEIRCSHPERTRCVQCHVARSATSDTFQLPSRAE